MACPRTAFPQMACPRLALESPFIPGEVVGRLHIFPHHERIRDRARQRAIDQALLLGGYTLVVALLTLALIQVRYVPAIKTIANDLHDINPGDTERLSIPAQYRHNELGHLVRDINGLLDVVSTRLASERRLRQEIESLVQRFRLIYERASVGIFLCDRHGQLLMANAALHRIIGTRPPADPPDPPIDLASLFADVEQANALLTETLASGRETAADLRLAATDSQPSKWGHCLFTLIRDDEGESTEDPPLAQGILTDITARKQEELRIRFQAERDPLTQLYNRRSAESELDALLVQAASHRRDVAVCLLDLDHFKPINDRFGHDAGDLVLTTIADRLRTGLRSDDLIARLGGDEFLVAIPNHGGRQAVAIVADKLLGYLTQPVPLACGNTVQVGISIGIALASEQGYNAQRLVQLADRAMYRVKQGGKNGFAFC